MGHVPSLCVLCSLIVLYQVVLWPNFGHSTTINVWERKGEKHLASLCMYLVGEGVCQPDIFHKHT